MEGGSEMKAGIRKTIEGLESYMLKHGYTGLMYPSENCCCSIDDLNPCGEDHSQCEFGYKIEVTAEEMDEGYDFMITNIKPSEESE
jgi:hypothetical protein